jgi:hypothetical protein
MKPIIMGFMIGMGFWKHNYPIIIYMGGMALNFGSIEISFSSSQI